MSEKTMYTDTELAELISNALLYENLDRETLKDICLLLGYEEAGNDE